MKIPFEWIKQYIKTDKSADQLAQSFTALGLMLDKPISKYENQKYSTEVLDLEHRMDRSDWLSILGCARDLAAFEHAQLAKLETYEQKGKTPKSQDKIKIEVKCPDLVNRFNTRVFKNITVKQSPDWLKNRLEAYGIPSINNIVDITNYVMVELGQPMHAQDLAKMEKPEIVIRKAKKGEQITTLLGQTLELDEDMFVLTQNDKPTVIGGIVGGASTGIDNNTKNIVLDAGNYNQTNIRKTSRKLKIQNETVLRYDKFLHPMLTELAIKRATKLILDLAGGEYYENEDWYPTKWGLKNIKLNYSRVKIIGGIDLETKYIKTVLTNLEYKILKETKEFVELEVPYFRTDVEVEDDIVADILRMYGYENILQQALNIAPPADITPDIYKFEDRVRDTCVKLGMHEHITDPLVTAIVEKGESSSQIILENAQSQLKNALRTSMLEGLQKVAQTYKKHKRNEIKLFEVGKTYSRLNKSRTIEDFTEQRKVHVLYDNVEHTPEENSIKTRALLDGLLTDLGINAYELANINNETVIKINQNIAGIMQFNNFWLDTQILQQNAKPTTRVITDFTNKLIDEISASFKKEINLGEVEKALKQADPSIRDIVIVIDRGVETEDKKVIIKVVHNSNDYQSLRDDIISVINNDFKGTVK